MPFPNLSLSNSALDSHGLGRMSANDFSADENNYIKFQFDFEITKLLGQNSNILKILSSQKSCMCASRSAFYSEHECIGFPKNSCDWTHS